MKQTFLIIFCVFVSFFAKAQNTSNDKAVKDTNTSPVFMVVERQPEFPGGISAFSKYLQQNVSYPPDALKKRLQGKVFVTFVVEKDGTLTNVTIARGVSSDIDAEALRVIKMSPRWTPGVQNGRLVRAQFTMPLSFKLPAQDTTANPAWLDSLKKQPIDKKIFSAVEKEPTFKGGMIAFNQYVRQAIVYPEKAKKKHIQGVVYLNIIIERDGSLSDFRLVRSSGSDDLDAEALRVMKSCPNWEPGMQNNRTVRVAYTVPIRFSLSDN